MESFRIQRTSSGQIGLERQVRPLAPAGSKAHGVATGQELEALSRIIEGLNERFGLNLGNEHRLTLEQLRSALDQDPGLDASARVNTRENVRLTFDPKVEDRIQEIVETNFDLYKRITDDPDFGRAIKDLLFDDYIQRHRRVEDLLKLQESKTLEFKSSLRWNLKEDRKDDKHVTHAALKTIAAFLNTEGGDLVIGVADDGAVLGIEHDRLENDDKFMRHLAQVVRNGLGDPGRHLHRSPDAGRGGQDRLSGELSAESGARVPAVEGIGESPGRGFLRAERPRDGAVRDRRHPGVHHDTIQFELTRLPSLTQRFIPLRSIR